MIRIGIIGCGAIVGNRHAPQASASPLIEIAGFYDVKAERAAQMAKEYGGAVYEKTEDMLSDKSIDGVLVCTPNYLHAEHTIAALNAGKHVMCEKPMATSVDEAKSMIEAAKRSGKNLMIGHGLRFSAAHKKAKAILESGILGKILSFKCTFGHAGPEQWSKDGSDTWFFDKKMSSAGSLLDLGIHNADILNWLIGDRFTEVKAMTFTADKKNSQGKLIGVDDNGICLLKTRGGICGTLTTSWTYYGGMENSIKIYCSHGSVRVSFDTKSRMVAVGKKGEIIESLEFEDENQNVVEVFADDIINGRPPTISGEEGLEALKIILACARDAQGNGGEGI